MKTSKNCSIFISIQVIMEDTYQTKVWTSGFSKVSCVLKRVIKILRVFLFCHQIKTMQYQLCECILIGKNSVIFGKFWVNFTTMSKFKCIAKYVL